MKETAGGNIKVTDSMHENAIDILQLGKMLFSLLIIVIYHIIQEIKNCPNSIILLKYGTSKYVAESESGILFNIVRLLMVVKKSFLFSTFNR